jgi:hypothetical protein
VVDIYTIKWHHLAHHMEGLLCYLLQRRFLFMIHEKKEYIFLHKLYLLLDRQATWWQRRGKAERFARGEWERERKKISKCGKRRLLYVYEKRERERMCGSFPSFCAIIVNVNENDGKYENERFSLLLHDFSIIFSRHTFSRSLSFSHSLTHVCVYADMNVWCVWIWKNKICSSCFPSFSKPPSFTVCASLSHIRDS